jgi:hypothetical protein
MKEVIFSFIGQIVIAGGSGAVIAYLVLKSLGKGWIENQFSKNLEAAKAEMAMLSARRLKLHDKEYTVFPEMWAKLIQVNTSLADALASIRQHLDFDRLSAAALEDWLKSSDLSEAERTFFSSAPEKRNAYYSILDHRAVCKAYADFEDFHAYFSVNRIFLSPDLKDKLERVDHIVWSVWSKKVMHRNGIVYSNGINLHEEAVKLWKNEVTPQIIEIEKLIQLKLFPPENKLAQKAAGKAVKL